MKQSFQSQRVARMIALCNFTPDEILPLFKPLITSIINTQVVWDSRSHGAEDLMQIGLLKCLEVIENYSPFKGDLTAYATKLVRHALWNEARIRPLDRLREDNDEDTDFDTHTSVGFRGHYVECQLTDDIVAQFRVEDQAYIKAAEYVFGVLSSNDYEQNRARVLKTLTHGYDINPKHARFMADHVLVLLRKKHSKQAKEVRDDALFDNKFKHTLIPELRELLGEKAFERLIHYFGGMTISIPSMGQINNIDRDLAILRALASDWSCGPTLAKKYDISPEGIKAVYKTCLHNLQTDAEYRQLVSKHIDISTIPGYDNPASPKKDRKPIPTFGEKRPVMRRKVISTDSMGFTLGCRNSLLYTLIITGKCTRADLVRLVVEKFGGTESAAKATVSAFLSDIKHPFGKFNTSRNLILLTGSDGKLSFEQQSLLAAQKIIAIKRQAQMISLSA